MARFRTQKAAAEWLGTKAGYFCDNDTAEGKWMACIPVSEKVNSDLQVIAYGETPMAAVEEAAKLAGM